MIGAAHVAAFVALVRLGGSAVPASKDIVWLEANAGAEANAPDAAAAPAPTSTSTAILEEEPLETPKDTPALTSPPSDISLASPAPTKTPAATPAPTLEPRPRPTATPRPSAPSRKKSDRKTRSNKPIPEIKPKRTPKPKASVRLAGTGRASAGSSDESGRAVNSSSGRKTKEGGRATSGAGGSGGPAGGTAAASEFAWYGNMLHDRFYSAWVQPTSAVPLGAKISTLVKLRIEKDGRVSSFAIIRPSGNVIVDESVSEVAKRVTQVDPPPKGIATRDHYDVNINFEVNPE